MLKGCLFFMQTFCDGIAYGYTVRISYLPTPITEFMKF